VARARRVRVERWVAAVLRTVYGGGRSAAFFSTAEGEKGHAMLSLPTVNART